MTQYNTFNVKLSNSQLKKLKSGRKTSTEVTLKFSSNVVCDSNDENNVLFIHIFLFHPSVTLTTGPTPCNRTSAFVQSQ